MSDITLERLIDQFRNKIKKIIDFFIISTHWYILENQYVLMKNSQVIELIDNYTKDGNGTMFLTYSKNNTLLHVLMFPCGKSFMASFKRFPDKMFKHVRLRLNEIHDTDYENAFGKVDELFILINTKTETMFEELSAEKRSKFLARSSSTLFGNIDGSFFSTNIKDICIDTNIVDPEQQDKIGIGMLITPKPKKADRDQEKK